MIGIKDTHRPDMDVAMERMRMRAKNWWVIREVAKVQSHLPMDQAPDKFYWSCNETVDRLATVARDNLLTDVLKTMRPVLLEGTRAICCIDGQRVNNNLYTVLQEKIMWGAIRQFLIEKYGWTDSIFNYIAWDEHHVELQRYPIMQRPTFIKYIHGWLATTQWRCREGAVRDSGYSLCGKEDSQYHFIRCSNTQVAKL